MEKTETINGVKNVTDLAYLSDTMGGNKQLIKEVMDVFLKQAPEELSKLNKAVDESDYATIKNCAHKMKSSVSIMGVSSLANVLNEMEELGKNNTNIEKIKQLNIDLNSTYTQAIQEIENEMQKIHA